MYFEECKDYLVKKLRDSGMKEIKLSAKALRDTKENRVGAVLPLEETFLRQIKRTVYRGENGAKKKRLQVMERKTSFLITIGEYKSEECEKVLEIFLASLDDGIYVDGNFVGLTVENAKWADEDDEIIRAKYSVHVTVSFEGGIYRDTGYKVITGIDIERVEIEKGE